MSKLRQTKDPLEIELLTKAIRISALAQIEVMRAIHNDMTEREVQGIHEFIYRKYGAAHEGYNSIVGAGGNACVLHYVTNEDMDIKDKLILMDVGAEYGNYSSDMTRTIPVSGRFSKRQKEVYNSVLQVKNEATKLLTIGNNWKNFHEQVGEIMTQELFKIGLIDKNDIKNETKKILDPSINVTATAVRVPVVGGHSEAINVEFENEFDLAEVRKLLHEAPGITLKDDPTTNSYPMPRYAEGKNDVFVGRIRRDETQTKTLNMWVVADNLRKGAATNAVQIAQLLIKKDLI